MHNFFFGGGGWYLVAKILLLTLFIGSAEDFNFRREKIDQIHTNGPLPRVIFFFFKNLCNTFFRL